MWSALLVIFKLLSLPYVGSKRLYEICEEAKMEDVELEYDDLRIYEDKLLKRLEDAKPYIKNWHLMEGIDFDYYDVAVDLLSVDRRGDEQGTGWVLTLGTTMYTEAGDDGRDVYKVVWRLRDLWGNLHFFSFKGPKTTGALIMNLSDYDDFQVVGLSIVADDDDPVFEFLEPDELSIVSVEKVGHQTLAQVYPDDYDGIIVFPGEFDS